MTYEKEGDTYFDDMDEEELEEAELGDEE